MSNMRLLLRQCSRRSRGCTVIPSLARQHAATSFGVFQRFQSTDSTPTKAKIVALDTNQQRDCVTLDWDDGRQSKFHNVHLRTWCNCPKCQHSTGQRLVNYSDLISLTPKIKAISVHDNQVHIVWHSDGHESRFSFNWLRENCYSAQALDERAHARKPVALGQHDKIPTVEYDQFMDKEDDRGLLLALHQVNEYGLSVIKNTPCVPKEVKRVGERVAPISHSFLYGDVFDVIAEHNPINIAYTNATLKLHLDLAYYESPPGLQLLHALQFDETVQGGESIFVDVFAAAHALRDENPTAFETLCRVPATFQKKHLDRANPAIMEYQRPHIQVNHRQEVIAVHWSPPFEGPLRVAFEDVPRYYEAYHLFDQIVQGGRFEIKFRLTQGDLVMFSNRRVLHGRKHFSVGSNGIRHLQGSYLNIDDAMCRYNVLRAQLAFDDAAMHNRRAGNGDYS